MPVNSSAISMRPIAPPKTRRGRPRWPATCADHFAFLGITNPARRKLDSTLRREAAADVEALPRSRAGASLEPRRSSSASLATRFALPRRLDAEHLALARELITCKSWWDTVDTPTTNVVGPLVHRFPERVGEMDRWIEDPDSPAPPLGHPAPAEMRRQHGPRPTLRLRRANDGHQDFFIRKAIGWALRQLAKTDPDVVRAFVAKNESSLSPLSIREATKDLR